MQEVVKSDNGARDVSRREFLASSAFAAMGAGLALNANAQAAPAASPASDKLRVALIGFGAEAGYQLFVG